MRSAIIFASALMIVGSAANAVTNYPSYGVMKAPSAAPIGGSALLAGACVQAVVIVAGATIGMTAVATPVTYPGDGVWWEAYISSANNVIVKVCAAVAVTPTASVYNVRVIQ